MNRWELVVAACVALSGCGAASAAQEDNPTKEAAKQAGKDAKETGRKLGKAAKEVGTGIGRTTAKTAKSIKKKIKKDFGERGVAKQPAKPQSNQTELKSGRD